jgi:hypothetical protein
LIIYCGATSVSEGWKKLLRVVETRGAKFTVDFDVSRGVFKLTLFDGTRTFHHFIAHAFIETASEDVLAQKAGELAEWASH